MGFFDIFKSSKKEQTKLVNEFLNTPLYSDSTNNYLADAAELKQKGIQAIRMKEYSDAWDYFHQQKLIYIKYADSQGFDKNQTLALDSSISEHFANILRLEGKHLDALIHAIYWCTSSEPKLSKSQEKKLASYLGRAKLLEIDISDLYHFLSTKPEFNKIKLQVQEWR
jgi:hypothetical protein